jgi:hypothetical protein
MKRIIAIAIAIVVFTLLAYFPDPFLLLIVAVGGGFWIGLPCIFGGFIALLIAISKQRSPRIPLLFIGSVFAIFALCAMAIPINSYIYHHAELAAKAYPEKIRPLLEAYRASHGAYPTSLDQISDKPPPPRLLRTSFSYHSDGKTYSFAFAKPGGLIDVWDYSSETHEWHLST